MSRIVNSRLAVIVLALAMVLGVFVLGVERADAAACSSHGRNIPARYYQVGDDENPAFFKESRYITYDECGKNFVIRSERVTIGPWTSKRKTINCGVVQKFSVNPHAIGGGNHTTMTIPCGGGKGGQAVWGGDIVVAPSHKDRCSAMDTKVFLAGSLDKTYRGTHNFCFAKR